nr:antitoxin VbhA family protein [Xanthomonas nasturtii]
MTLAITPELRREALTEAAASLRLEGLAFSEANDDLREAWIDGRMTGEEVRQGIIARAVEAQQVRDKGH